MKRFLCMLVALLLICAVFPAAAEEAGLLAGDVTQDGTVDGRDVLRLLKKLNGEDVEISLPASDVTDSATVGLEDLTAMMDFMAEKPETKLAEPVEREIKIIYLNGDPDPDPDPDPKPERRSITVEIFDRNRQGVDAADNVWTDYIKAGMLEKYNIEVNFVPVSRWTETDELQVMLAGKKAPDICYTYGGNIIPLYANMKDAAGNPGIIDLAPLLEKNKDQLPNLIALLGGEDNLYYDRDPETGSVMMLEGVRPDNARTATFIRKDWLDRLGLSVPSTEEEFHAALVAFRDNADLLLGADAAHMIPYSTSTDIGWRNDLLNVSKVKDSITDETLYTCGSDDRHLLYPGYSDGLRTLNAWYNEGLVWKDFALYNETDTEDYYLKEGYVGAFQNNWDYPFRNGEESINNCLRSNVGEDAQFIAVDCFKNDAGVTRKYLASPVGSDRKIFLPATNDEPEASLLYLDFISSPEVLLYLQTGQEGENHVKTDTGAYKLISAEGEWAMPSPNNIDYTITNNGLNIGKSTEETIALNYMEPAENIINAHKIALANGRVPKHYNTGEIESESLYGAALYELRDELLVNAVIAPAGQFDTVYNSKFADYMSSGGSEIIRERTDKLNKIKDLHYTV